MEQEHWLCILLIWNMTLTEVRVYPYGITTFNLPIASQDVLKGPNRSVTFTLNAGDYIVDATGTKSVQIQAGEESHLYFD